MTNLSSQATSTTTITSERGSRARRRMIVSILGLASVLALVAGCACSTVPPRLHTDPTVAVVRHVIAIDNTFAGGGNPFSRVLVSPKRLDGSSLSSATKSAINSELSDLGDVKVSSASPNTRAREAQISVGKVVRTSTGVVIEARMNCGELCALRATYELTKGAGGGWTVTGRRGPVMVS